MAGEQKGFEMYKNDYFTQDKADELLKRVIDAETAVLGANGPQRIYPHVRITHNVSTLGSAKQTSDSFGTYFRISVSDQVARDERRAVSILTHEVLHTCPGCFNHGTRFKRLGEQITEATGVKVSRTYDDTEFGDDGHLLSNERSGKRYHERVSDPLVGKSFTFDNGLRYTVLYRVSGLKYNMFCECENGKKVRMRRRDVVACMR